MDLLALETFAAVARCGSITAAARELNTVQSNVTVRMRQLETRLGTELFRRHSRGMTLTVAGERLLSYARKMMLLAEEAAAAVQQDGVLRGRLRLGSMETTAAVRLPRLLCRFHAAHPEVAIELRTGPTAELLERVLGYELDGAFVAGPIDHPDLAAQLAFVEELVLVRAAVADPIERRRAEQPLTAIVFRSGCAYRQRLETCLAQRGWQPYRRLEIGTLEGILGLAAAGAGVTLLPRRAVEHHALAPQLRLTPVDPPLGHAETLLVSRSGDAADPQLLALADQIVLERAATG